MSLLTLLACTVDTPAPAPPAAIVVQEPAKPLGWRAGGKVGVSTLKNGSAKVPATLLVTGELTFADPATLTGVDGEVSVDLATWDSELELRDERIRDVFFEHATHPTATFEPAVFGDGTLEGRLTLHGVTKDVSVPVEVLQGEGGMALRSTQPWIIRISDYGMDPQLQNLITLCAHESVADEVEVTLDLRFGEAPAWPATPTE